MLSCTLLAMRGLFVENAHLSVCANLLLLKSASLHNLSQGSNDHVRQITGALGLMAMGALLGSRPCVVLNCAGQGLARRLSYYPW